MKKIFSLLMLFSVVGCFSTPNSNFYILENMADDSVLEAKLNIGVYDIVVPEYVDRPQIVLQKSDLPELKVSEFNRWAADLPTMLQNVFIDNLTVLLPNANIRPLVYGITSQYIIKIEVEKFIGWLDDKAVLKARWQILNTRGKIIFSETNEYQIKISKSYASYVQAQSKLWSDLATDIANKLKNN